MNVILPWHIKATRNEKETLKYFYGNGNVYRTCDGTAINALFVALYISRVIFYVLWSKLSEWVTCGSISFEKNEKKVDVVCVQSCGVKRLVKDYFTTYGSI